MLTRKPPELHKPAHSRGRFVVRKFKREGKEGKEGEEKEPEKNDDDESAREEEKPKEPANEGEKENDESEETGSEEASEEEKKGEKKLLRMSISSDAPCDMGYFREVLDHSPEAINLERLNEGMALLWNHDRNEQIGRLTNPTIENGKIYVDVQFSRSQLGREKQQDVEDGILREVSIGYERDEIVLESSDEEGDTYRTTRWMPYEASFAPVPADHSVGVGRSRVFLNYEIDGVSNMIHAERMPAPTVSDAEKAKQIRNWVGLAKTLPGINLPRDIDERAESAIKLGLDMPTFRNSVAADVFRAAPSPFIGMSPKDMKRFSLMKALRESAAGQVTGLEKETSDAAMKHYGPSFNRGEGLRANQVCLPEDVLSAMRTMRTQLATQNTAGGFLVATNTEQPIPLLRPMSVLEAAGCTVVGGLVGNVLFPVHKSGPVAYWVAEDGSTTASEAVWGQKLATPHRSSAQVPIGQQLIAQASIDVESYLMGEMDKVVVLLQDIAGLEGSGVGGEPMGIKFTTGINAGVTFGGAPTWADVVQFETDLTTDNALLANPAFILSPATVGKWKTTVQAATFPIYLLQPNPPGSNNGVMAGSANGYPAFRTSQITGDIAFFGCFSELMKLSWAGRILTVDPFTAASNAQVKITIHEHCDFIVRQPTAFSVSTDSAAQ